MSEATRRGFLVIAGAGAAATIGAVATGTVGAGRARPAPPAELSADDLAGAESFVVYIKDVRRGRTSLKIGRAHV